MSEKLMYRHTCQRVEGRTATVRMILGTTGKKGSDSEESPGSKMILRKLV
jgi:hypothetical protein